jgi:hypothetical protein
MMPDGLLQIVQDEVLGSLPVNLDYKRVGYSQSMNAHDPNLLALAEARTKVLERQLDLHFKKDTIGKNAHGERITVPKRRSTFFEIPDKALATSVHAFPR